MAISSTSSDLIVDGTLWALVAFSITTWTLIFYKVRQHIQINVHNKKFLKQFWSSKDLLSAAKVAHEQSPAGRLVHAGFKAVLEADAGAAKDLEHSADRQELLERFLRHQIHKERRQLETGLSVLASIGSTAPFVGLFGTVWGIMHALSAIGGASSASLDVVAGPIGEALLATGIGIAVAVPAVLAYNVFLRRLKVIGADLDEFSNDYVNLLRKSDFKVPNLSQIYVLADKDESSSLHQLNVSNVTHWTATERTA